MCDVITFHSPNHILLIQLIFSQRQHWKTTSPICIDVTVPLSVSVKLSRSCIVLKRRQKISTRFFLHNTAPWPSLADRVKIWLTSVHPFSPNFSLNKLKYKWFRWQIATELLEIAQWSQWKPPSLFRMLPSLTFYDLPSPKWGFRMHPYWKKIILILR